MSQALKSAIGKVLFLVCALVAVFLAAGRQEAFALTSADFWMVRGEQTRTATPELGYEVEIVSVERVENGVELFVKAWDAGLPIGFGSDGTVEIERFRVLNPPTRVPTGATEPRVSEDGFEYLVPVYVEDVESARLRVIEDAIDTISTKQPGGVNIEEGKVGRTTTIVYGSDTDGVVSKSDNVWATAHGAVSGTATTNETSRNVQPNDFATPTYYIDRSFFLFDTSAIPDTDEITAATLSVYAGASGADANSFSWGLVGATPATDGTIVGGDYDDCGSTEMTARYTEASVTDSAYKDMTLDADGLANLDAAGWSQFCLRGSRDLDNSAPTGRNYRVWHFADSVGTTNDPKLTLEHAAGPEPEWSALPETLQGQVAIVLVWAFFALATGWMTYKAITI